MTDSINLPPAEGGGEAKKGEFMPVGCHRMRIDDMEHGKDGNGVPILDKRNHPCIKITFINEDGEKQSSLFFYNELEIGDPKRQDDTLKCKSEFRLSNLRIAMGLDTSEELTLEDAKTRFFFGVIQKVEFYDPDNKDKIVKSFHDFDSTFYPDADEKPKILGDPANNDGNPGGVFVRLVKATNKMMAGTSSSSSNDSKEEPEEQTRKPDF